MLRIAIETEMTNDGVADVTLWFSTLHELSEEVLFSLSEYLRKFDKSIDFSIRIKTQPCVFCSKEEEEKECLSGGDFCPIAPIHKDEQMQQKFEEIGGRTFMMQSLLVKMVLEELKSSNGMGEYSIRKTLNYMSAVSNYCPLVN